MMNTLMKHDERCPRPTDLWGLAFDLPARRDARCTLVAVATASGVRVDRRFEDAEEFLLYEKKGQQTCFIGRQPCPLASAAGDQMGRARLLADCDLVLCANISETYKQTLSGLGIDCNLAFAGATVNEAVSAL